MFRCSEHNPLLHSNSNIFSIFFGQLSPLFMILYIEDDVFPSLLMYTYFNPFEYLVFNKTEFLLIVIITYGLSLLVPKISFVVEDLYNT